MKCGTVTVGVHWFVRKKIEDAVSVQFAHEEHYQVAEDARKRGFFATFFSVCFEEGRAE